MSFFPLSFQQSVNNQSEESKDNPGLNTEDAHKVIGSSQHNHTCSNP